MSHVVHTNAVLSDRYLLERELGRGGMGVVYQARDLKHAREVAVKVLGPEPVGSLAAERFVAEIRTAAGLNHPNIVSIHDSGDADGILYYVMPRVEGEPLSSRLQRERRLPMDEALEIARQVADGLAYAHARGIVHRDIKPENILLDRRGHASITDFGVARALSSVSSTLRTAPGMAVGSPLYMSPEQAAGERDIDGRSDIYSLGCMLFEMLAGEPPFSGGDIRTVMRQHLTEPPPSLRLRRADVPPDLDAAVQTALAKSPEERHPSASAFVRALESSAGAVAAVTPSPRRGRGIPLPGVGVIAAGAAVAIVIAVGYVTFDGSVRGSLFGAPRPDTSRYAVLPLRRESAAAIPTPVDVQLHDAFAQWHGLEVVDRLQVADAVARSGGSDLTGREALEVARSLGAGRYVHGAAMVTGDRVRLDAGLYDAVGDGRTLRQASLHVPFEGASPDSLFARLAESLLFGRVTADERPVARVGTESVAARRDYGAAHEALQAWDLSLADSLFEAATTRDPDFTRAHLWLAQVRNWAGDGVPTWSAAAEEAYRGREELAPRERQLATGLVFLVRGRYDDACRVYEALRERDERDFAAWYGLGECHSRDPVVVRDRSSPSGWSFRSSYHRAVEAYARAFEVLPLSHRGFTAFAFQRVREVLFTRRNRVRRGEAAPRGEGYFVALPTWQGDTLAFVPYRWRPGGPEIPLPSPELRTAAVLQQRRLFRETARSWARSFPESPDAIHALAVSLQMVGDPAALDTIRRARSLARDPFLQLSLASEEVWIRVRFGIPDRPGTLAGAVALADSLLEAMEAPTADEAALLSRLAALLGRPALAADLGRLAAGPVEDFVQVPEPIVRSQRALLAFSAAGAPRDSIAVLERETEALIRNTVPLSEQATARAQMLERPAILAFPTYRFPVLDATEALQSPPARALGAWWRGERADARRILTELRSQVRPTETTLDILYPVARLLAEDGDTATARSWLEAGLSELRWTDPGVLEDLGRAGVLGRAMVFHATLAERAGRDEAARRWAAPVTILWAESERWLHPALTRMRGVSPPSNSAGPDPTRDPLERRTP